MGGVSVCAVLTVRHESAGSENDASVQGHDKDTGTCT